MGSPSSAFATVLRSERDALNAEFAQARKVYPGLSGEAFLAFLGSAVDPLVAAVAAVRPERVAEVARTAYSIALSLVAQRLVGEGARLASVDAGWRTLLPNLATHIAESPAIVLGAVSNALHNLESAGARAPEWMGTLWHLGPSCPDVPTLLRLGEFAAWRTGAAHLRDGALRSGDALPGDMAARALGAPADAPWPALRARLESDPWFFPGVPPGPRVGAVVGAFRGFGGTFVEPPRVRASGAHFVVTSGEGAWLLVADAFGATLHRATPGEIASAGKRAEPSLPKGARLDEGRLSIGGSSIDVPASGAPTSAAENRTTIALTFAFSHAVVLVSRGGTA